jgi:hypothetical protein
MKLNIQIERLVLEGIPVTRLAATEVRATVERELAQLLTHGGLLHELRRGAAVPNLKPAKMIVTRSDRPRDLANSIAHAAYSSLGTRDTDRPHAQLPLKGTTYE